MLEPLRAMEDCEASLIETETFIQKVPALGTEAAARFATFSGLIKQFMKIFIFRLVTVPARV